MTRELKEAIELASANVRQLAAVLHLLSQAPRLTPGVSDAIAGASIIATSIECDLDGLTRP